MNRTLDSPAFQPSQLKQALCHSWCDGLEILPQHGALEVRLPYRWPDGDLVRCFLEQTESGGLQATDWGGLIGGLFLQGIHSSPILEGYALSEGFFVTKEGEIQKALAGAEDVPSAVMAFARVASVAFSELSQIAFEPSRLIVPLTWGGILFKVVQRPGVLIQPSLGSLKVDKHGIIRKAALAMVGGEPKVVSPYIRDDKRGYSDMTALFLDAIPEIRGIVPLIKAKSETSFVDQRDHLAETAARCGRGFVFNAVPIYSGEDVFDPEHHEYPAVRNLTQRAAVFGQVLDEVMRVA